MALDLAHLTIGGTTYLTMRIQAGVEARTNGQVNIWDDNSGAPADLGAGTIIDGSATTTLPNTTNLIRFGRWSDNNRMILNAVATRFGDNFTGPTNNVTVVHEAVGGAVTLFSVDERRGGGAEWVDWWQGDGLTADQWSMLNAIASGDQVILAIHTGNVSYDPPPPMVGLGMSAEAGDPTAAFDLTAIAAPPVSVAASASAGNPTAAFDLTNIPPPPEALAAAAEAGDPTTAFDLTTFASPPEMMAMSAEAGDPTAAFAATVRIITVHGLAVAARSGPPTAAAALRAINAPFAVPVPFDAPWRPWQWPDWYPPAQSRAVRAHYDPPIDTTLAPDDQGAGRPRRTVAGAVYSPYGYATAANLLGAIPEVYQEDIYLRDIFNAIGHEFELLRAYLEVVMALYFVAFATEGAALPGTSKTLDYLSYWAEMAEVPRYGLALDEWRSNVEGQIILSVVTESEMADALQRLGQLPSAPTFVATGLTVEATIDGVTVTETARRAAITAELRARLPAYVEVSPIVWVADVPGSPTGAALANRDGPPGGLILSWTAPTDDGGFPLTYRVRWREVGTTAWSEASGITATSYDIMPLEPGDEYEAQVRAESEGGESAYTTAISDTIDNSEPSEPLNLSLVADNGDIGVSWDAPLYDGGEAIDSYTVGHRLGDSGPFTETVVTGLTHTITGLTEVGDYEVRVRATSSEGDSINTEVETVNPFGAPGQPVLTAMADTVAIDLAWTTPANGGRPILGYIIEYMVEGGSASTVMLGAVNAYRLEGLVPNVDYAIRILAFNELDMGPWSVTRIARPTATVPSAVRMLEATAVPNEYIEVTWDGPASTGGLPLTEQTLSWSGTASGSVTLAADVRSYRIMDLEAGCYDIQVIPTNPIGDGPPAIISDVVQTTVPDDIELAPIGSARRPLLVDWDWQTPRDGGQRISSYMLEWRQAGQPWSGQVVTVMVGSAGHTVPDATADIEARVKAVNSIGEATNWSPTGTVDADDLLGTVPDEVRVLNVAGTTEGTFSWPWSDVTEGVIVDIPQTIAVEVAGGGTVTLVTTPRSSDWEVSRLSDMSDSSVITIRRASAPSDALLIALIYPQPDVT